MKLLIYNEKDGEVKLTVASTKGPVFRKYVKQGYKSVCYVFGWGPAVTALNKFCKEDDKIIKTYEKILRDE